MSNVTDISERRPQLPFETCVCGSVWFDAAACFQNGSVSAYGKVKCRECGKERL